MMPSQILRPTQDKHERTEWLIRGSWGRRTYEPMSKVSFWEKLHTELMRSGILPFDSPAPSNRHHAHVTMAIMHSSWIEGRWVPDESFAARLKRLREGTSLTQEQLAEQSGLDVGTIRQLEQGTRTNPQWQTVSALVRGLDKEIVVFVGTDGWHPPNPDEDWKRRQQVDLSNR